jgi:autotransporter family porin
LTLGPFLFSVQARAVTFYVKANGRAAGDGRSWARPFRDLQDALAAARAGDSIWVAAGAYHPTAGNNRDASFVLIKGVSVYGGFQGSETQLSERDWRRNRTVLSGDIGETGVAQDNVYHVVRGADDAVLDGFVITAGNGVPGRMPPGGAAPLGQGPRPPPRGPGRNPRAGGQPIHITPRQILSGPGSGNGAGMINYQAAPTVRNCVFENNRSAKGGAVYNMVSKSFPPRPGENSKVPLFINCTFRNNFAMGRGGGVSNDLGTAPVFLNCVFEANETPQKGGGMYNDFGCSPLLINCLFRGNKAQSAAAMGNDGGSSPVLDHCTFTRNHAQDSGPSLYQGTGPANNPAVIRCVIWDNTCDWEGAGIYNWHDNTPLVEDSVVQGGYAGASAADPGLNESGVAATDVGYKPGDPRFTESKLADLLETLSRYQRRAPAEPAGPGRRAATTEALPASSDRVVYVNGARPEKGDGRSWTSAYSSLQAALEDAVHDGAAIWVAAGVYKPSASDRSASFILRPGVSLYGGFTGRETRLEERDWTRNATILSGDIGVPGKRADNSYHVLIGANGAVLDGFTITGGYADGTGYDGKAGGMINYRRGSQRRPNLPVISGYSPEVRNCTFTGNYARDGGAVYNYDRGKPKFLHCVFLRNQAGNGGAVLDRVGVEAVYEDCQFTSNASRWRGGAAYFDYGARPVLKRCTFTGNSTSGHGGAVFSVSRASQLENTLMTFSDCRFDANTARGDGGAAAFHDGSLATLQGCSFSGNKAGRNGGAVAVTSRSSLQTKDNTFAGNTAGKAENDVYNDRSGARQPQPASTL